MVPASVRSGRAGIRGRGRLAQITVVLVEHTALVAGLGEAPARDVRMPEDPSVTEPGRTESR